MRTLLEIIFHAKYTVLHIVNALPGNSIVEQWLKYEITVMFTELLRIFVS